MSAERVVYVVAKDLAVRETLRVPLAKQDFDVRLYETPRRFIDEVAPHPIGCCVLADVDMPEGSGFGLLIEIKQHHLALPVIFITSHANCPLAIEAMRAGAIDLLERPLPEDALVAAVRRAQSRVGSSFPNNVHPPATGLARLTKREHDILAGLLKGQPNKIIAHELGISRKTVEVHRANLMAKTGARTLAELVRMGLTAESQKRH